MWGTSIVLACGLCLARRKPWLLVPALFFLLTSLSFFPSLLRRSEKNQQAIIWDHGLGEMIGSEIPTQVLLIESVDDTPGSWTCLESQCWFSLQSAFIESYLNVNTGISFLFFTSHLGKRRKGINSHWYLPCGSYLPILSLSYFKENVRSTAAGIWVCFFVHCGIFSTKVILWHVVDIQ